jgi:hypothetical protein
VSNLQKNVPKEKTMGRTVLPFSQVLEQEYTEWKKFRRALRQEDQEAFDRLFERAKLHVQAAAYASPPWPMEAILLAICLEHEKILTHLQAELQKMQGEDAEGAEEKRGS